MVMSEKQCSFRDMFCRVQKCKPEDFESRVFHQCLHRRVRWLAGIIEFFIPSFFMSDLWLIQELAKAKAADELMATIQMYQHNCHRKRAFLHDIAGFRISCGRIIRLFDLVMSEADKMGNGASP